MAALIGCGRVCPTKLRQTSFALETNRLRKSLPHETWRQSGRPHTATNGVIPGRDAAAQPKAARPLTTPQKAVTQHRGDNVHGTTTSRSVHCTPQGHGRLPHRFSDPTTRMLLSHLEWRTTRGKRTSCRGGTASKTRRDGKLPSVRKGREKERKRAEERHERRGNGREREKERSRE